jgi:polysaccharide biosynthesis/export protein
MKLWNKPTQLDSTCQPSTFFLIAIALLIALTMLPMTLLAQNAPDGVQYRFSPGDTLDIAFRWTPEFNQSVIIQPDGHASLLSAGDLKVSGLTLPELHDQIVQHSKDKLVDPEFTIMLKEGDRPHFVVAGEVATPGKYDLRTATTALQAVLLAGGGKESGDTRHVILFRRLNTEMAEVHRLNFSKFGPNGRPTDDMLLQPGDMLLVTPNKLENIGRFVRAFNLGIYFNPIGNNGL